MHFKCVTNAASTTDWPHLVASSTYNGGQSAASVTHFPIPFIYPYLPFTPGYLRCLHSLISKLTSEHFYDTNLSCFILPQYKQAAILRNKQGALQLYTNRTWKDYLFKITGNMYLHYFKLKKVSGSVYKQV